MDYYQQKFFLPQVDKDDRLIGPIERWQAHRQAILHRGFTAVLFFQDKILLQQRKHPAFDNHYDLTFSSHPIYINNQLQTIGQAIIQTLAREWNLQRKDLETKISFIDKFYYQAKDPNSIYTEHEIDYLYQAEVNALPKINQDFAYGYELIDLQPVSNLEFRISNFNLCPWVKKILQLKSFQQLLRVKFH